MVSNEWGRKKTQSGLALGVPDFIYCVVEVIEGQVIEEFQTHE